MTRQQQESARLRKLILDELQAQSDSHPDVWLPAKQLAALVGCSYPTVLKALDSANVRSKSVRVPTPTRNGQNGTHLVTVYRCA